MMINTLTAAAALLLVWSGAAKLGQPGPAATMVLRLLRRPARQRPRALVAVRAIGAGEVGVGLAVVLSGSRPAVALLGLCYLAFAAVALALLRSGGRATSCGCFGSTDSVLGPAHVVLTVIACAAGIAATRRPPGPALGLLHGGAVAAVTGAAQAVLLAALGYLAVTALPALLAARRALAPPTPQS